METSEIIKSLRDISNMRSASNFKRTICKAAAQRLEQLSAELGQVKRERLKRYTKDDLLDAYRTCFRLAVNYINIRNRYDGLKSYIDILNGVNTGFLDNVKRIEELYELVTVEYPDRNHLNEFQKLVGNMPDEVWIQ